MMKAEKQRAVGLPLEGTHTPPAPVLWKQACKNLQKEISVEKFVSWIKPLVVDRADSHHLYLVAPNAFFRDWVEENLGRRLSRSWHQADPLDRSLRIRVGQSQKTPGARLAERSADENNLPGAESSADKASAARIPGAGFDSFVVGESNEVAFTVARQVSQGILASFNNPLFIFGGYGVGKTHLLNAISESAFWRQPGRQIRYLTAEEFVYDYVSAVRERDTRQFKQSIRSMDLLLVDDLQFIVGKQASQEEFFHSLCTMVATGAQVVLSADQAPGAMQGLHPGLLSRIVGGLVCEIRPASLSLRRQILERRLAMLAREYLGLAVPSTVLDIIAEEVCSNPRELIGALNTIVSRSAFVGRPLTGELCREILADLVRDPARKVSIAQIQKTVAAHYNLTVEQLLSRRRTRNIVRPRQVAMYLAKLVTTCSLPMIGGRFNGRDHATVIHANRQITALLKKDAALADDVKTIRRALMSTPAPHIVAE